MCDCYDHKCFVCGQTISMHLEDFSTGQEEIGVFHEKCFKKAVSVWKIKRYPDNPKKLNTQKICVVSLTQNALEHQDGNHPNEFNCERA